MESKQKMCKYINTYIVVGNETPISMLSGPSYIYICPIYIPPQPQPLPPLSVTRHSYARYLLYSKLKTPMPKLVVSPLPFRVLYFTRLIVSACIGGSTKKKILYTLLINRFQTGIQRPFGGRVHTHAHNNVQVDNDVKKKKIYIYILHTMSNNTSGM